MRRRDYITGFVLTFGLAFGLLFVAPGAVRADPTVPPIDSPEFEAGLQGLISGKYMGPTGNGTVQQIPGWAWDDYLIAGQTAKIWPKFVGVAAPVVIGVSGFEFGWKIGRVIDTKFLHLQDPNCIIFGCPATPSGTTQVPFEASVFFQSATTFSDTGTIPVSGNVWTAEGSTTAAASSVSADGAPTTQTGRSYTAGGSGSLADCHGNNYPGYLFWTAGGATVYTGSDASCSQMFNVDMAVGGTKWNGYLAAGYQPYMLSAKTTNGCGCFLSSMNAATQVWGLIKSDTTVQKQLRENGSNPADFTNQTVNGTTTMPTTSCNGTNQANCAPGGNLTAAQLAAIRGYLEGGSAHIGTPGETNCLLDPTHYNCPSGPGDTGGVKPDTIIEMPEPLQGETGAEYRDRLRELGYLGTVVFENDPLFDTTATPMAWLGTSPYNPGVDPATDTCLATCASMQVAIAGQVTRVGLNDTSLADVFNRTTGAWAAWPDTPPTINLTTTTSVVVVRAPATWTPPTSPTEPPGQPAGPPTPGTAKCGSLPTIPAVSLTPLTSLDFGNAFPFGVFGWLSTVYGYFNVPAVAPSFDINLVGLHDFVPGFTAHYSGNLGFFSSYMSGIRAVISFALWVGAIWYIGVTLLGFRGGGDVSDAADEGLL